MDDWASNKAAYMIIKSISATEGLEWDTVDMADPKTWKNYMDDLRASYFSDLEILKIVKLTTQANGLDQDKIDEALESFLVSQEQVPESK